MWLFIAIIALCFTSSKSQSEYFWQLSDVHYDPTYWTNQESCNVPIAPGDLGEYGNIECDSPWNLTREAIIGMAYEGRLPKFIIWSGDSPPHSDNLSTEKNVENIRNITEMIKDIFPDIPVFPVLGNHDYFPKDQFPSGPSSFYDELGELWKDWINFDGNYSEALDSFKKGGFYTRIMHEVSTTVRAVVLNTNLYSVNNKQTEDIEDPGAQFEWLETTLARAVNEKQMVHLMIHIPPGFSGRDPYWRFMRQDKSDKLYEMLQRFGKNIIGIYAAHLHYDSFHICYDESGDPVATMFNSPSVTPWKGQYDGATPRNPAIRRYFYDTSHLNRLTDYSQLYLDLTKANEAVDDARWRQLYSFNQVYGSTNLEPEQVNDVKNAFKEFAGDNFHNYYDYNSVGWKDPYIPCGCLCKDNHICAIENVDDEGMQKCLVKATSTCKASTISSVGGLIVLSYGCKLVFG